MNYRSLLIVCLATLGLTVAGWGQADDKIAFISHREGSGDVWIMNADGGNPVNLTQGRDCASPAWSPDGTQIAYIDSGEIWLMDADGSNPQQVTDDPVDKARLWWSEDGSSIYYIAVQTAPLPEEWDGPDAFVTTLDGRGSSPADWREVYRRFLPGVSPDGTQLTTVTLWDGGVHFHSGRHIRPGETDTAGHGRYEAGHIHANFYIRTSVSDHMHPGLLLPESLQNRLRAEELAELLAERPDLFHDYYDGDDLFAESWRTFPTWSPDGTRIAFSGFLDFMGQFEIWAADTDGSNWVELTNGLGGHSPAWQPALPAATSVEAQSWGRIKSLLSTGIR